MTSFRQKHGVKIAWAVLAVALVIEQYWLPRLATKWLEWVDSKCVCGETSTRNCTVHGNQGEENE
jgi:hypothetical protein